MEEYCIGSIAAHAPGPLNAKWNQRALKKAHDTWQQNHSEKYQVLLDAAVSQTTAHGFINIQTAGIPMEEYDVKATQRALGYTLDWDFLEKRNDEIEQYAHDFAELFIAFYKQEIEDSCPELLTEQEYAIWVSYQTTPERLLTEEFGVTRGTIRKTVGRVREKIESARELVGVANTVEQEENQQICGGYSTTPEALEVVNIDDLPIDVTQITNEGLGPEIEKITMDGSREDLGLIQGDHGLQRVD